MDHRRMSAKITLGYLLPDCYTRHDYKPVRSNLKVKELFSQLSNLTKSPSFEVSEWYVQQRMYTIDELQPQNSHEYHQCICSCTSLEKTFIIEHKSGICCTIGSECIHHFGNDDMSKTVRALEKQSNRCVGGKLILDRRTTLGRKGCCGDVTCGCVICNNCNHHKLECTCNYCIAGNLITRGDECGRKNCPCYRCKRCKRTQMEKCSCHKCVDCKEFLQEMWKQRCLHCFKNQKVKCKTCDEFTISSRPLCTLCYVALRDKVI
jgi:hypothetical protein